MPAILTIFTPTYNRAYILPALYESLQTQTCKDFEWVIVDDGSTDDTEQLIRTWTNDTRTGITIRYYRQPNGGKHRAINHGVRVAEGELFFIVDSDDNLPIDAVSNLLHWWQEIADNSRYAGISGLRSFPDGTPIGGTPAYSGHLDTDSLSLRVRYHEKGDKAEAFRTAVLREFPFPEFDNEQFMTEAVVWNRIAQKYILRYHDYSIYHCDYLSDGLTRSIVRHHFASPQGTALYYSELSRWPQSGAWTRIKAAINYWRYSFGNPAPFRSKWRQIGGSNIFLLPLGLIFSLRDRLRQ